MRAHRVNTAIERDGTLVLEGLPFDEGEAVEVIVLPRSDVSQNVGRYTLRGKPVRYDAPREPVARGEREAER